MIPDNRAPVETTEIARAEALKLLAGVPMGRVAFSHRALPTVRPVNHVVDGGDLVIRTRTGAALLGPAGAGSVVAYEADEIDPVTHTGWSVVVTGTASLVTDEGERARYGLLLTPWTGPDMQYVVRISTDLVTGLRMSLRAD